MDLEEGGEEAIIDIGAHVTNIVVHDRGDTRFVRILPSRRPRRDHSRSRGLRASRTRRRAAEARRGDRGSVVEAQPEATDGPGGAPAPEAGAAPRPQQVRHVALQRAAAFVDEVRSSLEFYTAQAREARIAGSW